MPPTEGIYSVPRTMYENIYRERSLSLPLINSDASWKDTQLSTLGKLGEIFRVGEIVW